MLLTQDRSLYTETECESRGKQTGRNSITLSPILSSPLFAFSSLISSHLLSSFLHPVPFTLKSFCTSLLLIPHLFSNSIFSHFPAPVAGVDPMTIISFSMCSPPAFPRPFHCSNLEICTHIENMNNFKFFRKKTSNHFCSAHKDTYFRLIICFSKQKIGGFLSFDLMCMCAAGPCAYNVGRWDGAR